MDNINNTVIVTTANDLRVFARELIDEFLTQSKRSEKTSSEELLPLGVWLNKYHISRTTVFRREQEKDQKLTRFGRKIYATEAEFQNLIY